MAPLEIQIHPDKPAHTELLEGLRLRTDTLYTNHKGKESRGTRNRAQKALNKLSAHLAKVLQPDEAILYVARAQAPAGVFEQLTFGWYIYYITGTVLVFTNRRLLHFLVTRDGTWKKGLRSVYWGDVAEARAKGWLNRILRLKYRSGKKETYWGLSRADIKKMRLMLGALVPGNASEGTAASEMVSLCPSCSGALVPKTYQCGQCHLRFKDEGSSLRLSLLIPGGGYFYTGHWFLGILDFIVEGLLLVVFLDLLVSFLIAPGDEHLWITAITVGSLLAIEKALTVHHARRFVREFIPAEGGLQPLSAGAITLMAVFLISVASLVWLGWSVSREPTAAVEAHLAALNGDDIELAYSHLSPALQAKVSLEAYQTFVAQNSAYLKTRTASFPNWNVEADTAVICGTLTGQSGKSAPACFTLVRRGDRWLIEGINLE